MSIRNGTWVALAGGLLGLVACSASTGSETHAAGKAGTGAVISVVAQAGTVSGSGPSVASASTPSTSAAPSGSIGAAAGGGAGAGGVLNVTPSTQSCDSSATYKKEGCACRAGETAACWTGPVADRNVGMCHDGLQICSGGAEFASWGPCMGEQKVCGTDAGVPPPPPEDNEECTCIPGAVIQCSEDCSVGIICSLTASKTCLPDGTWSQCREEPGVMLDLPGVQCRNMLHGCFDVLKTEESGAGDGELFVGDCSKQFKCGHAPPPVKTPPSTTPTDPNPT